MTRTGETEQMFHGYQEAADYLGLKRNTLSSYVAKGIGPEACSHVISGQYVRPVYSKSGLDHWQANRPGQGARTDLVSTS